MLREVTLSRVVALAGIALLCTITLTVRTGVAGETVDLDRPGALETLQQSRPAHYAKVVLILQGISRHPDSDAPRWMRVGFDARDVSYAPIVLTSHPAQRRLSFALEDTRYVAVIVLTNLQGVIVPLR